ncbi:MAG: hypothetical protein J6P19_02770 [Acetobacter sp.]|nr:hypothetical protein [Acetobacter sp.]
MLSFYRYLYHKNFHQRSVRHFIKNKKGVSAIEFALVFPVFIAACVALIYMFMLLLPQITARFMNFQAGRYIGNGSSNLPALNSNICSNHASGAGIGALASGVPHPLLDNVGIAPYSAGTYTGAGGIVNLSGEQFSGQARVIDSSLSGLACKLFGLCNSQKLGDFNNQTYRSVVATPYPYQLCGGGGS